MAALELQMAADEEARAALRASVPVNDQALGIPTMIAYLAAIREGL